MPNLEPTYLRYVYDSLNKGSLNAENAAALPRGFIGLYEQGLLKKYQLVSEKSIESTSTLGTFQRTGFCKYGCCCVGTGRGADERFS